MRPRRIVLTTLLLIVLVMSAAPAVSAQQAPDDQVTVVMTELAPFVVRDDGFARGFYAEIWDEVALRLDVEYDIVWVDSFGELLDAVADGRAEIAVAPLAPTADREARFDFTSAVITSGPQLGYSDRLETRPSLVRSIFDPRIALLAAIALGGLMLVAHVMWLVERGRHGKDGDFHESYLKGIWDGLWWSTVTATTVGYGDKAPKSFAGRAIALIVMLSSLILVGAFVSQVTSIMAEDLARPSIESINDIDHEIGVVTGSSFAEYLEGQGLATIGYETQDDVFEAVLRGEIDVVVANPYALETLPSRFAITPVEGVLYEEFETFGLQQGSAWREPINQALADLQASGAVAEMIKDGLN